MGVKSTDKGNKSAFWDFENTSGKRKYKNTHALGYGWPAPASATGGTKVVEGLYTIHHFPNPSYTENAEATFVIADLEGSIDVDYIVIGGGGGGGAADPGAFAAGGGGAGTVHVRTGHPITNGTFPVISGKGGTNSAATPTVAIGGLFYNNAGSGQDGVASTCFGLTAPGGGGGGGTGTSGAVGGSSGGGSHGVATVNTATGDDWPGAAPLVSPTDGWGNPNHAGASATFAGGGGGGAGSGGPPATRNGGAGIDLSPMVGTTFGGAPAADDNTPGGGYFAGGGGAGYYGGPKASGGSGGGGPSGYAAPTAGGDGARALLSTGSGGGGSDGSSGSANPWNDPTQPSGTFGTGGGGGPGIVIIRYLTADL